MPEHAIDEILDIPVGTVELEGNLTIPEGARGLVVFALTWLILPASAPLATSIFSGLAAAVLLGGLLICLSIARKGGGKRGDQ